MIFSGKLPKPQIIIESSQFFLHQQTQAISEHSPNCSLSNDWQYTRRNDSEMTRFHWKRLIGNYRFWNLIPALAATENEKERPKENLIKCKFSPSWRDKANWNSTLSAFVVGSSLWGFCLLHNLSQFFQQLRASPKISFVITSLDDELQHPTTLVSS